MEKGFQLIRNTSDFEYALTQWEDKDPADKTWANFKTHFHEHQLKLKKVRGPTMQQAGYHHANLLASRISQDIDEKLQERDSNMIAMLQSSLTGTSCSSSSNDESESLPSQAASSVTSDHTQLAILQLLREIQVDLKQSATNPNTCRNGQRKRFGRKTPDDKTYPPRDDKSKYCWTHGACNHGGSDCRWKAKGHKDEATFDNKMGGSCAYCN